MAKTQEKKEKPQCGQGNARLGNFRLEKCQAGEGRRIVFDKMSIGELSVGDPSLGKCPAGKPSYNPHADP